MWRWLGVEAGERRIFAWAGGALFLLGWADVSVRNASEVFFVKRVDVHLLPLAFLASSLLLLLTTWGVARLASRRDRLALLPGFVAALGLALVPLWLLLQWEERAGATLLLFASKQLQALGLLAFLLALGDLLHPRQLKRLMAPLLAGLTLGTILGSFASEPLGGALGIAGLLPFSAVVLAATALATRPLRRSGQARLAPSARAELPPEALLVPLPAPGIAREGGGLRSLWGESGLFRLLALTTVLSGLLGPLLYFQFQYVADLATAGQGAEEARLLGIYAAFRGWLGVGILATQLGLASALYRRIGLPLAAAISPLLYLLGFAGLSVRLSLATGVGAMAGAKLVDNAIYDPAVRTLYNLFREDVRPAATALLEGPLKRAGGVLGNGLAQAVIWSGGAAVMAWVGLPFAAAWVGVSVLLWRRYPALLLEAATARTRRGADRLPLQDLVDASTERALARQLTSPDPETCRLAVELCSEASPRRAVESLARAARDAPEATRSLLVAGLDRVLEAAVEDPVTHRRAAEDLAALLLGPGGLPEPADRANAVQAFGRLTVRDPRDEDGLLLEGFAEDPAPGVRLAARAALARRGFAAGADLDARLQEAARGEDVVARQIAREELRALLIQGDPGEDASWGARLEHLAALLEQPAERAFGATALADVAERHGARAAAVRAVVLAHGEDPDPAVRASVSRYAGAAGLRAWATRLVEQVDDAEPEVAEAAREALRALGPGVADLLLVELSYGRRSRRDALLRLVREIHVEEPTLRELYRRELEAVRQVLLCAAALAARAPALVRRRLEERMEEGAHTLLLLLSALHGDPRLGDLGDRLRRIRDVRRRALLLEALESLLDPEPRDELLPLLEDLPVDERARRTARSLGRGIPAPATAVRMLLADGDELTRRLVSGLLGDTGGPVATPGGLSHPPDALKTVETATYLRRMPLFAGLATRHLLEIAGAVREERHPTGAVLFREGEPGASMYLVVEGQVAVGRGRRDGVELGPAEYFGEVGLLEGARRTATATARSDVRLLRLERDALLALMEDVPAIAISVAQELSRRFRETLDRIAAGAPERGGRRAEPAAHPPPRSAPDPGRGDPADQPPARTRTR